jgi:predicted short-subunit dehydrogenase-like oxidoreductase (DUF2520 family)
MASSLPNATVPFTGTVGFIGAGRVGAVLAAALDRAGYPISAVAGESAASRIRIETMLPGVAVAKPTTVSRAADLLFLTVPDDSLDNVVRMLSASGAIHARQYVVHTSGRHGLEVLEPAVAVGARAIALHPAMTFTGSDLDIDRLPGCVFGVTARAAERPVAEQLVADFGGRIAWLAEQDRILYHAALAHGSNHLTTLVNQSMDLLRKATPDIDPSDTLRPLLTAALDNALTYADAGLTGPIVRGDVETVREHVARLLTDAPSVLDSYVALARATAGRALASGRLDTRRAAAILDVLADAADQIAPR